VRQDKETMTALCKRCFPSTRLRLAGLFALQAMLSTPSWAQGQPASPTAATSAKSSLCVRLLNAPVISIDPTTGSGEAVLLLTNQTEKEVNAAILGTIASPQNSPAYLEFSADTGSNSDQIYETKLGPKATIRVRAILRNDWEDGEFDIDLTNHFGAERVGKVHVRRIPVGIKLEGTDRLKLALLDGVQTRILLRNDDPKTYSVTWKLLNGEEVCSGPTNPINITAKSLVALECTPTLAWQGSRFANLLKPDQSHDGYNLMLLPHPFQSNSNSPSAIPALKVFKGEASLDFFKPFARGLFSYPILALILFLGGLSSLLLSYFVPNKLKRLTLRDQLLDLAARTSDLSTRIDSKLAVLVRLERSRLADLLKSRTTISPDFSTIANQCGEGITRLTGKVCVLEQMDLVLGRLEKKTAQGVPPTQVSATNEKLQLATVLLGKGETSDAEIQAASATVAEAATSIDKLNQPDDTFARDLGDRIRALLNDVDQTIANSPTYKSILLGLPGPNQILRFANSLTSISADKYVEFDTASQKMRIIREYVLLREETTDTERVARLSGRQTQLMAYLQLGTWQALTSASLLLREMRDDVFPERIVEVLRLPDEACINVDPAIAYERAPLELSICFQRPALNTAAAREQIGVDWDFGDGLKGKGWSVCHYFQIKRKQNTYKLHVTFRDPDGKALTDEKGQPIAVERTIVIEPSEIGHGVGERTRLEILKLGVALVIAVFGLVSGAQDQIARLDLLPGIIAVFLVGFSADSIKRLLTT
jgi:hypothetical protein